MRIGSRELLCDGEMNMDKGVRSEEVSSKVAVGTHRPSMHVIVNEMRASSNW